MKSMITNGLRLANQSSQQWQEKKPDEQEPLATNALNSHNNKFDNRSPRIIAELPF